MILLRSQVAQPASGACRLTIGDFSCSRPLPTVVIRAKQSLRRCRYDARGLQPAAHGRLVAQVLRTESPFEVLLLFPYDEVVLSAAAPTSVASSHTLLSHIAIPSWNSENAR